MCKKISIITLAIITFIFITKSFATNSISTEIPEQKKIETGEVLEKSIKIEDSINMEMENSTMPETNIEIPNIESEQLQPINKALGEGFETDVEEEIMKNYDTQLEIDLYNQKNDKKTSLKKISENDEKMEKTSIFDTEIKKEMTNEELNEVLDKLEDNGTISKIENLNLSDIIDNENISERLEHKIREVINTAQSELKNYKITVKNNYKTMNRRLLEVKRELNGVQSFKDRAEYDLEISKWIILTLSLGVICLTFLIIAMWRSITNVGKNEIEVLFAYKNLKEKMEKLTEQIDLLHKKNTIVKEENKETI